MKAVKVVLTTKLANGETAMAFPVTELDNVEASGNMIEELGADDCIPIMQNGDGVNIKQIKASAFLQEVSTTANNAKTTAESAAQTASEASETARAASESVSGITEQIEQAQQTAESASSTAQQAQQTAQEALETAQAGGGGTPTTVDDALSTTSTNPVQNKVVNAALETKLPKTGGAISGDISVTGAITATGNITGAKVYNAVWNADYAEGFDFEGDIPERGKIVELCGDNKVRTAAAGSDMVIGVCSESYWALAGCSVDDIKSGAKVAVGIAGQLPVKVRGAVRCGDYIVCGGDGIGEVRSKPRRGTVIGRAMESNTSAEIKDVNCIIQLR